SAAALAVAGAPSRAASIPAIYHYLSPVPNSVMVSPRNNVAIRVATTVDATTLVSNPLSAVGDGSGPHTGSLVLSDDGRTMIFVRDVPFGLGEKVTVHFNGGARTTGGESLPPFTFSFTVGPHDPQTLARRSIEESIPLPS